MGGKTGSPGRAYRDGGLRRVGQKVPRRFVSCRATEHVETNLGTKDVIRHLRRASPCPRPPRDPVRSGTVPRQDHLEFPDLPLRRRTDLNGVGVGVRY